MELELPNQILSGCSTVVKNEIKQDDVKKLIRTKEFDEISLGSSMESEDNFEQPPDLYNPVAEDPSAHAAGGDVATGTSPQIKIDTKTLGEKLYFKQKVPPPNNI